MAYIIGNQQLSQKVTQSGWGLKDKIWAKLGSTQTQKQIKLNIFKKVAKNVTFLSSYLFNSVY